MLLLEYGEYFFEDRPAISFPVPSSSSGQSFEAMDALKVPGRLKICSRCLIFEPTDRMKALVKFPFKNITTPLQPFEFPYSYRCAVGEESVSQSFTFSYNKVLEMKDNNLVGPYRHKSGEQQVVFILSHLSSTSPIMSTLLSKIDNLRSIFASSGSDDRLLEPLTRSKASAEFDLSELVDFHEKLTMKEAVAAKMVSPLILFPGFIMVTEKRFYFQPSEINNAGLLNNHIDLSRVRRIYKKRYLLQETGLELLMEDSTSVLFCLDDKAMRDAIYSIIRKLCQSFLLLEETLEAVTARWKAKEMSNFDYLMFLNLEAGRSLNDLGQYPVFPHVLTDFTSPVLDLTNPNVYRDLSKPVGALNKKRLEYFKTRFRSMPRENISKGIDPPFLYGTHYSSPAYVLYYLVRVAPEHMLCLQNGKFDAPDRMFNSIADSWLSCLDNPTDVKELIPEFFSGNGSFLRNRSGLEMGRRQTGQRLSHVELPPWATDAADFIKKHTEALESAHVTSHLNEWIDLIFGDKQRGLSAEEADNLFFYLTYAGSEEIEAANPTQRAALMIQIQEFGQTPKQLFFKPHVKG